MNNIVDKNIIINGSNNVVVNTVFTNTDAKIVVSENATGTEFVNISENRIERKKNV